MLIMFLGIICINNNQVKDKKIDILVQQYEEFVIP
jgi:hypothetical protein